MLSGGTDSTYAAIQALKLSKKITLVTFTRTGLRRKENVIEVSEKFIELFKDHDISHTFIDFQDIYQRMTPHEEKKFVQQNVLDQKIGPMWEDPFGLKEGPEAYYSKLRTMFMANECLQCKIAMHLSALEFCVKNGIDGICDGSNTEQLDDGSQLDDVKEINSNIFHRYGISFISPAYHVSREERNRTLYESGITEYKNYKELEKTHQISTRQIQCTVPSAVLWTTCIFPWMVYDGRSCEDYMEMCVRYFSYEMERGIKLIDVLNHEHRNHSDTFYN